MSYAIDVSKGKVVGAVSAQWANRSDDQRFVSLSALRTQVAKWKAESSMVLAAPSALKAVYDPANPNYLGIEADGIGRFEPSNWGFEQVARVAGAPANYLRGLPGPLAAVNLNYGLQTAEPKDVGLYIRQNGSTYLRGVTSPRYGRIYDVDVVDAVMKVAGNGTGDTRWKVPGCIDWSSEFGVAYNPNVDITKQNTTLYASDRDVFLFLVDDLNPIEVGKLANGDPDLMFRGFYVWNSEVGARTFGIATMYLRGVCQNRNLWGVEDFNQITFKHTASAPERFIEQAAPALLEFANASESRLISGVKAAKAAVVASTEEDRLEFLARYNFSNRRAQEVIDTCLVEEQKLPESVWDFAQAVSALARFEPLQEDRLAMEQVAGQMLNRVKVAA